HYFAFIFYSFLNALITYLLRFVIFCCFLALLGTLGRLPCFTLGFTGFLTKSQRHKVAFTVFNIVFLLDFVTPSPDSSKNPRPFSFKKDKIVADSRK
ncbi:hypothetical protein OIU83_14830, partial [Flavobacterium sp. LS1R49]